MHGDSHYAKSKTKPIKVKVAKSFDRKSPKIGAFLFGANHTLVNLLMLPPSTLLLPEDFKSSITFDIAYKNILSGNFPKKFKFKHMLPNVFRLLRSKFQINEEEFIRAFKEEPIHIQCKNMNTFESFDHSFVFKIVENEYIEGLLNLMPSYFRYLSERKFNTLLPQYCSIFKITIDNKKSCIVVMKNIMSGSISNYDTYEINCSFEKEPQKDHPKDLEISDDKKRKKQYEPPSEIASSSSAHVTFKFDSPLDTKASILEKATHDSKFLCENNVYGWSFLACRTKHKSSEKHFSYPISSPSKVYNNDKRFSYGISPLLNDYYTNLLTPLTPVDDAFLEATSTITINSHFVNTTDFTHSYYLGCMDISNYCKHVKKSFSDKLKKKQLPSPSTPTQTKTGENDTPTTPNNHQKSKGKSFDPNKLIQSIEVAFVKSNSIELPTVENDTSKNIRSCNSSSD